MGEVSWFKYPHSFTHRDCIQRGKNRGFSSLRSSRLLSISEERVFLVFLVVLLCPILRQNFIVKSPKFLNALLFRKAPDQQLTVKINFPFWLAGGVKTYHRKSTKSRNHFGRAYGNHLGVISVQLPCLGVSFAMQATAGILPRYSGS